MNNKGKPWSSDDMVMLKRLADSGASFEMIAIALSRPIDGCKAAWGKYFGGSSFENVPVHRSEVARLVKLRADKRDDEAIGFGSHTFEGMAISAGVRHVERLRHVHPEGYQDAPVKQVRRAYYTRHIEGPQSQSALA